MTDAAGSGAPGRYPVGVLGAGVMGAGIAQVAAAGGHPVVLYSRTGARLRQARVSIRASLARLADRGSADPGTVEAALSRITTTTDVTAVAGCPLVVESVAEDPRVKRLLLGRLDALCPEGTVFATNTSSIPITRIAEGLSRPDRVVGTHFFAPVPMMRLCEVVRGRQTSDATVALARRFVEGVGKTCIVVERDVAGFVTTRLMAVLILEAARLVESGVSTAADVDTACRLGFGHAMGPLATADLGGLDVLADVARQLYESHGSPAFQLPGIVQRMVERGDLGRKSGRGFHTYAGSGGRA